jgi:hypothetical protein
LAFALCPGHAGEGDHEQQRQPCRPENAFHMIASFAS